MADTPLDLQQELQPKEGELEFVNDTVKFLFGKGYRPVVYIHLVCAIVGNLIYQSDGDLKKDFLLELIKQGTEGE